MAEYDVEWVIELDADTPEEAARLALEIMRDPESIATAFRVTDCTSGVETNVDLLPAPSVTQDPDQAPQSPPLDVQGGLGTQPPRNRTDGWDWHTNEACDLIQNDELALGLVAGHGEDEIRMMVADFQSLTNDGPWHRIDLDEVDWIELEWFFDLDDDRSL